MIVLAGATSLFVGTAFQAQMPEFAHHHGSEEADVRYSVLFGANAAGAVIGAVLLESVRVFQGGARTAIVCAAIWGIVMGIFPLVDSYAAADDRTLVLKLKQPFPLLVTALGKPDSSVPFIMPERLAGTAADKPVLDWRFVALAR